MITSNVNVIVVSIKEPHGTENFYLVNENPCPAKQIRLSTEL